MPPPPQHPNGNAAPLNLKIAADILHVIDGDHNVAELFNSMPVGAVPCNIRLPLITNRRAVESLK